VMVHDHLNTSVNLTYSVVCVESGNERNVTVCDCVTVVWLLLFLLFHQECLVGYGGTISVGVTLNELVQSRHMNQHRKSILFAILPLSECKTLTSIRHVNLRQKLDR